jgi:flagellar export protein FliJ
MDRLDTWTVLSTRAQGEVDATARALARSQETVERIDGARQKVRRLLQECLSEQADGRDRAISLGDRRNAMLFIEQLQSMEQNMLHTLRAAHAEREAARARLAQAQVEAHKANHLVEQADRARRESRSRQEQLRLDEWSTMRHGHAGARQNAPPTDPQHSNEPLNTPAASPPR